MSQEQKCQHCSNRRWKLGNREFRWQPKAKHAPAEADQNPPNIHPKNGSFAVFRISLKPNGFHYSEFPVFRERKLKGNKGELKGNEKGI